MALIGNYYRLPSPLEDVRSKPTVFWGTTNDNDIAKKNNIQRTFDSAVRAKIIEDNFNSKEPFLYTLGQVRHIERTAKLSNLVVLTLKEMNRQNLLAKKCLQLVGLIGLGGLMLVATYCSKKYLFLIYDQMQKGLKLPFFNSTTYTKIDFYYECFMHAIGQSFGYAALATFSAVKLTSKDAFISIYKRFIEMGRQKYAVVQDIEKISSLKGTQDFSNGKEDGLFVDPITLEQINNIDAPSVLLIGRYAIQIENVLKRILAKDLDSSKMIQHPLENRPLTLQEQDKFINDICAFFCIARDTFLDCWELDITIASVPDQLREHMDQVRAVARIIKFFECLPQKTLSEHFTEALLQEHRLICQFLSTNQRALTTIQVLGFLPLSVIRSVNIKTNNALSN